MAAKQSSGPVVTRKDIVQGLTAVGLKPGDSAIVHTALSKFGFVEGGPDTVVEALEQVVGPRGTLMFPTFTGDAVFGAFAGGAGSYGAVTIKPEKLAAVDVEHLEVFHEELVETGAVNKAARRRPDYLKSYHPMYSICAKGPLARQLVEVNRKYIFPTGKDKDMYVLGQHGGKALLMGVPQYYNSCMHLITELAEMDYKIQDKAYWKLTVEEFLKLPRARKWELLQLHCGMNLGYNVTYTRENLEPLLTEAGIMTRGRIGGAEVMLMPIAPMVELGLKAVRENPEIIAHRIP